MRKTMKSGSLFTGALTIIIAVSTYAITLAPEEFTEYAPEEAYWVVSVNCGDGSDSRVIQRKTDGTQWCSKDVNDFCFASKTKAADEVCSEKFSASLTDIKKLDQKKAQEKRTREAQRNAAAARTESQTAARRDRISTDEKLLQIEQKKLSLRKQELKLQRRAIEIRDELKALEN